MPPAPESLRQLRRSDLATSRALIVQDRLRSRIVSARMGVIVSLIPNPDDDDDEDEEDEPRREAPNMSTSPLPLPLPRNCRRELGGAAAAISTSSLSTAKLG